MGGLRCAALDITNPEPLQPDHDLWYLPLSCYILAPAYLLLNGATISESENVARLENESLCYS